MEVQKGQVIVGEIVGFVVAKHELCPDRGIEFDSANAAMDSRLRGFYFKKLRLASGKIEYYPGVSGSQQVGREMYGVRCSCGVMVWCYSVPSGQVSCEDCTLREATSGYEPYDGNQERED